MPDKIVYRVEDDMDKSEIKCTTYQMRNFYIQLRDGFASNLDVMNYIQHLAVTRMMKPGDRVLDMCCGRSLVLPFMRFFAKEVKEYVGVEIEKSNLRGDHVDIRTGKPIDPATHYPFKVTYHIGDVSKMDFLEDNSFDMVIYTSSIEHMQKDMGVRSLEEAYRVMKKGATMFLSCPNTPEDKDGYDTQYKAHLYEWKISEIEAELFRLNFKVKDRLGLVIHKKVLNELFAQTPFNAMYEKLAGYLPSEFLTSLLAIPFYKFSNEVLYIVQK